MKSEKSLIRKIQKHNDKQSANLLISNYYKEIYAFVYKQTGDKELSMDLTQEIFISVLQSIEFYSSAKSSFKTWLYRIASNKVIDYFRSSNYKHFAKAADIETLRFILADDENVEISVENKLALQEVMERISLFDFEIQQILRLKFFSDKTFSEIGEILSLSENTVKTKYYTAIKKLRKEIKK